MAFPPSGYLPGGLRHPYVIHMLHFAYIIYFIGSFEIPGYNYLRNKNRKKYPDLQGVSRGRSRQTRRKSGEN